MDKFTNDSLQGIEMENPEPTGIFGFFVTHEWYVIAAILIIVIALVLFIKTSKRGKNLKIENERGVELANFDKRFTAYFIDYIFLFLLPILIVEALAALPSFRVSSHYIISRVATLALLMLPFLILLLNIFLLGKRGQSIGKMAARIRCINDEGKPIGFLKALIRELFKLTFSTVVFYLGFFWMCFNKKKQTWHDLVVGSHVEVIRRSKC